MTRQIRLILILGVMAGAGVGSLAFVANRYRKALETPSRDATGEARRLVDGFVAARQAVRSVDARYAGDVRGRAEALRVLRNERYAAFKAHGMTMQDYVTVRGVWRAVHTGAPAGDEILAEAFRARPAVVADAALLPDLDALDEELK